MARKTSDIAMLLGSRSKARTSKSTGLTSKLVGFIDSMLGRPSKGVRRQEKREQTVPLLVFAIAVLAAFGGGYAVGGGFGKSSDVDPLRAGGAIGRTPTFDDEVITEPMAPEAFTVSAYKGVPAAEANHAVRGAIDEALRCKEEGRSETILFNLCGHGHFDMQAYMDYFGGKLQDLDYDEGELAMALAGLPSVAAE